MRKLGSILLVLLVLGSMASPSAIAATLTGKFTPIAQGEVVNLTGEGPLDWVHWGLRNETSVDRKTSVTPQIPDFTPIGFNGPYQYGDNFNGYSWNDGTPTLAITNTITGVWMYDRSNGFELKFQADTSLKTVKIYAGTFAAVGKFEATLSGTSLSYTGAITNASNGPGGVFAIDFAGSTPGQTLTIKYLVERVFDAAGNVTLQAAALTAPGANNPPIVSVTDPGDNATFSAGSDITIDANATDVDGNVTLVEFFQGTTRIGQATNSPFSFTWANVPPGEYVLTARATDDGGASSISSPVDIFVNTTGGLLAGNTVLPPSAVDLTAEGASDWAHWGLSSSISFDHKAGVVQQISNFAKIGANDVQQFADNFTAFNWSDGTPATSNDGTRTGVFIRGLTNGFLLTAPADADSRTLKVYVGLYGAQGNFQAYLSDFSAPAYTDTSLDNISGNDYAVYTINYAAASTGQTLTIRYTTRTLYDADYGNITLQAATLTGGSAVTNLPPTVTITSPTNNTSFIAPADIVITAAAYDSDGSVSKVEFFDGTTSLGEVTNAPYSMVWSNVAVGSYSLTARATDNIGAGTTSNPITISVVNPIPGAVTIDSTTTDVSGIHFSFQTQSGVSYTVQFTDSLDPINWQTLSVLSGTGSIANITDTSLAGAERFYRVFAE